MIKRIGEKEIFKTKIFTIKELELELDTGKRVKRQILDKGDTSLIVPLTIHNDLILVKEYFPAIDEYQLGLPDITSGLRPFGKYRLVPPFVPHLTAGRQVSI